MKNYFYLLLLSPILFSCAEKVKTCKISSVSMGNSLITYKYNGDQLENITAWNNSGQSISSYNLFSYTDQKIQMDAYNGFGQFQNRVDGYYDINGRVSTIATYYDYNDDGHPEYLYRYDKIFYDSGKPDSVNSYILSSATSLSYKYHWTGDNLTSFQFFYNGTLAGTGAITYDDSPNPYYTILPYLVAAYVDYTPTILSKNSATHFLYYDEIAMAYINDDTYTNTLDSDGNLTSNGSTNYSYQCEEN